MSGPLRFQRGKACSENNARLGVVDTPHGSFQTPAFMPVATAAAMKGVLPQQVEDLGAEILLNNAYHLMLRPGVDLIKRMGGAHAFMRWNKPILTDSGGYQAFSMSDINSIDEDGVSFRSFVSGENVHLGPESSMEVQNAIGADIIMAFDDCPPSPQARPDPSSPRAKLPRPRTGRHDLRKRTSELCVGLTGVSGPTIAAKNKRSLELSREVPTWGCASGLWRASAAMICPDSPLGVWPWGKGRS